jgi:hypothetical protein
LSKPAAPHIAVLGGGPIGLEAALYGRALNFPVTLYERGRIGQNVHDWGHVHLFSPFGMNTTPLGRSAILAERPRHPFPAGDECITGRQYLAGYIEPLAATSLLKGVVFANTNVPFLGRAGFLKHQSPGGQQRSQRPFRLFVQDTAGEREAFADVVLDCTGTYGLHRWLGDGGIPAIGEWEAQPRIRYGLDDILGDARTRYAGKLTLVVGAGYSAATSVCQLATLAEAEPGTRVTRHARALAHARCRYATPAPAGERPPP